MIRNLPGQHIGFDFIDPDGLPVTVGSPVVYVTKDNGDQTAGGGTTTHKGQGSWSYALTQADTDAAHIAIKPVLAGAFAASINVYPRHTIVAATAEIIIGKELRVSYYGLTTDTVNLIATGIAATEPDSLTSLGGGIVEAVWTSIAATIVTGRQAHVTVGGERLPWSWRVVETTTQALGSVILPSTATVPARGAGTTIRLYVDETISQAINVFDAAGDPLDLSAKTLAVEIEDTSGVDIATVADADITVSGVGSNVVAFAVPADVSAAPRTLRFTLRDAAAPRTVYVIGRMEIIESTEAD